MEKPRRVDLELVVGGHSSRADRGAQERPASGEPTAAPSRALPFDVPDDATLEDLIDAVLAECLRHVLANREPAMAQADLEGVHQLRVGMRRMRSALMLFDRVLARQGMAELRRELRWVGRELSAARDWDVFASETLGPLRAAVPDDPGLRQLAHETEAQRRSAHAKVRATLTSERFARFERRLERYVSSRQWRPQPHSKRSRRLARPARRQAARLLERRLDRVLELGDRIDRLPELGLHRLRIRLKQLRYASEFLAPLYGGRRPRRYAKRLATLQDVLGHVNDGRVTELLLDQLVGRGSAAPRTDLDHAAGVVTGWSHRVASEERRHALRAWKRFDATRAFWR